MASKKVPYSSMLTRVVNCGALLNCDTLRDIANALSYIIEPTGSNSAWQNGKVERLNGTFGIMVRCLLYSSGLSEKL
jgi:hypothetical protein